MTTQLSETKHRRIEQNDTQQNRMLSFHSIMIIEQNVLDTNAWKQLSLAATDV